MANLDQIAKLDEGVEVWNQWRKSPPITPELSEVDFSGKDLSHADLHRADLRGVNSNGSNLSGASLREYICSYCLEMFAVEAVSLQ